jgi:hypothetical protein
MGTNVHPFRLGERVGKPFAPAGVSLLSENTIEELKAALAEQLRNPGGPTPELAKLLKEFGAEARAKKVKPEELIVIFKQIWNSLAESIRTTSSEPHEPVRQMLVTLCIQAYYAE